MSINISHNMHICDVYNASTFPVKRSDNLQCKKKLQDGNYREQTPKSRGFEAHYFFDILLLTWQRCGVLAGGNRAVVVVGAACSSSKMKGLGAGQLGGHW